MLNLSVSPTSVPAAHWNWSGTSAFSPVSVSPARMLDPFHW